MIKNYRTLAGWGVVVAATATAVTATIGATAGGPVNPQPTGPQARPTAGQEPKTQTEPRSAERRRIASSVLGKDVKYTLTALRSRTDPLAASVRLQVFTFHNGTWRETDRALVGEADSWFWFPLTGRHAVCAFSTSSTQPAPVAVSMLVTPSVGCSPTANFRVDNGRIVPV